MVGQNSFLLAGHLRPHTVRARPLRGVLPRHEHRTETLVVGLVVLVLVLVLAKVALLVFVLCRQDLAPHVERARVLCRDRKAVHGLLVLCANINQKPACATFRAAALEFRQVLRCPLADFEGQPALFVAAH